MNKKALNTLEYFKIIEKLTDFAGSKHGKELCQNLLPSNDLDLIINLQQQTTDAQIRILKKGSAHFNGIHDIRPSVMRLKVESPLNTKELLQISSNLDATLRIKAYGGYSGLDISPEQTGDSLTNIFADLEPLSDLNNEIKRCIIAEEELADDSSPELKRIRRSIKNANDKIQNEISKIMSSSQAKNILQENIVTMRNGRYCLPVKSEYKNHFQGMVHDQSSTGSTFFIEPLSVVKLNNEIKELSMKEKEEIEIILKDLSYMSAQYLYEIENNFTLLSDLDFIFARATLSITMKGTEPKFNNKGYINIKKARHPLIDKNKVVPIDITIGRDYTMLIITGPNTGGKTVSLKTVGLLTVMGQSGLHIPAFDDSELAIFKEVYADIGDEQSIEQSLSTFSSHMTNIVTILEKADHESLVLFDELGAGTDPTEGAALAISILSYLKNRNIRTLATTHYSELKVYALSTPGIINASCEFDIETLRPTYRLLIGIPGKSNAFAISSKLGLPDFIIKEANKYIGQQEKSFEDLLSELEVNRIQIENEKEEISRYRLEIEQLNKSLEKKSTSIELQRERILNEAKEDARKLLTDAKDYADESIRKYNKWLQTGQNIKDMEDERTSLREKLETHSNRLNRKSNKLNKKVSPDTLKVGDSVHVNTLGLDGIVGSLPNPKGDLQVQMGILNSMVNIKDISLSNNKNNAEPDNPKPDRSIIKQSKAMSISTEINLIGKTVDEALPDLDKYLDDAYLSRLSMVRVIHGRGTGALKAAIHKHLRRIKYIKGYHLAEYNEGGDGVTIVEFK
ncbi:MAG TPA: endonuclease MutS2 [Clostridiales bacterium]|nr:endonuclease MutS2 [Clostridiales bacterium]